MTYHSDTVATIIGRLNLQFFLPAIQREFVWTNEQVAELFDSVMRGYPIGSFLFWRLFPENTDRWEIYRFVDTFKAGSTHNQTATTFGVKDVTLVLDGQQRLTAFLIGLKGSYAAKKKWKRSKNPDAWTVQRLCLDLLHDPKLEAEDGELGLHYGFEFRPVPVDETDGNHLWFEVGRILDFDSQERFDDFVEDMIESLPDSVTKSEMKVVRLNLTRLYRAIWLDDAIAYYTEHDQDYDRVLDIFVRANEGGTPLSKSDLLLSMVTSKWEGINAREEIYGFVDYLNHDLPRKNDLDKDFVLKSCLVLADLPVKYKVENFNNVNLALIHGRWSDIKSAIERGVKLVNSFGIDRDTLTSKNAMIPVIYYLYRNPTRTLLGTSDFDNRNRHRIRSWLVMALLTYVFGRAADDVLRSSRDILRNLPQGSDFPVIELNSVSQAAGGVAAFGPDAIETVLDLTYGKRETLLALTLLYEPIGWGTGSFHQDHIFPKALFDDSKLKRRGFNPETRERLQVQVNLLANLQLLASDENSSKSAKDVKEWLLTRDDGFAERHFIPTEMDLELEEFERFFEAREKLIRNRFRELFKLATNA